ncbi:hypothetical protein BU17DRAFT_83458 [Hysterangium stoloniferum]|nr:hypothetical protein BU17DRAFT_83458 [Hysterangium stoloniferum]
MPVSTTFRDYYGILGITKAATAEEIKGAYKNLALQWHPDRHAKGKEVAGRKFIEINEAYKFLMDSGRREWYDNFPATGDKRRSAAPKNEKSSGVEVPSNETPSLNKSKSDSGAAQSKATDKVPDVEVPPPSPFPTKRAKSESGMENPAPAPSSPSGSRFRTKSAGGKNVEADLRDFIHRMSTSDKKSSNKEQSFKSHTVYDDSDSDAPSIRTGGVQLHTTTVVTTGVPSEWIFPLPLTLEELLEGTSHRYRITRHLLSGKKKNIVVDVDVAPGWKKGTKIRFAGAGNERQGNPPQDVVFIVEEAPHERFVRQGSSLVARVDISLLEALTGEGRNIFVKGLDGQDIEVNIPPGVVKPGDEFRVAGAGMPIRKQGAIVGKGDMIIRWEIIFPQHLSKKQIKGLRKVFAA